MSDPQLIWLRPERGARGPAPAHSRAEIAGVAVELADAEGLAGVSMRKVAAEMEPSERPSGDPRADLAEFARRGVALLRRHPWLPPLVSTRLTIGPNSLRQLEYFLGIMSGVDVPAVTKMELYGLLNGFLYTFAQFEANQRDTAVQTQADIARYVTEAAATGNYPNLVAAFANPGQPPDPGTDAMFERTLPRVIDMILGPSTG